ncbi:glycosyltransferase [Chitinibacter bivalviorum]|uniref:Glycosyltransferase n=1 Tax=Chitinibacter bivalviorum TaxID=2739434 RepID=A0A7H9BE59_9NEIS|nr:glycosyltransferase [Chitinibacter bivalviorum]QLG87003.1 glycosyltransferase [Chitinibacter bivalviorum]
MTNAHAYRWSEIADFLAAEGHYIEVVTSRCTGNFVELDVDATLKINRVGFGANNTDVSVANNKKSKYDFFIRLARRIYRKVYWPDARWHWVLYLIKYAFSAKNKNFDLIVSYYPFMSSHIMGALLKFLKKDAVVWISDYGDPFSVSNTMPPNNFAIYSALNHWLEKLIINNSDCVTFTNSETRDTYSRVFGGGGKLSVVPHLVDLDKYYSTAFVSKEEKPINVVYTGGFHKSIREPYDLIDIMEVLEKDTPSNCTLTLYGPDNGFSLDQTGIANILYAGEISRRDVIGVMKTADVLVNVENKNCMMTPSKIVEYIATGRPIINLGDAGKHTPLLVEYAKIGYALNLSVKDGPVINAFRIKEFLAQSTMLTCPISVVKNILKFNRIEEVSSTYLNLYEERRRGGGLR